MPTTYDPNGLVAGDFPLAHRKVTILSGAGVLARGTVLGRVAVGAGSSAAKAGGNTGDGTFVLDATTPVRLGAKVGVYQLRCITAVTNGGVFRLIDPDGFVLGDFTIAAGAGGTVTVDNDIKGVLTDGDTDFAAGDGFDITVAAGADKYVKSLAAAVDGSQVPGPVLATDVDATSADADAPAYFTGEFASEKMVFGAGHTAASVDAAWRKAEVSRFIRALGAVA